MQFGEVFDMSTQCSSRAQCYGKMASLPSPTQVDILTSRSLIPAGTETRSGGHLSIRVIQPMVQEPPSCTLKEAQTRREKADPPPSSGRWGEPRPTNCHVLDTFTTRVLPPASPRSLDVANAWCRVHVP